MLPLLRVGPLLLQTPLLALLVGLGIGMWLAEKEAARLRLVADDVYNVIFYGLLAGLLGARLVYAAGYLNIYLSSPLDLIAPAPSTLSPVGGLIAGVIAAGVWGRRKNLPLRPTLDALAPGLACLMIGLGTAHLLSGDAYGAPANLPWSISLWGASRHPSQGYEILLAVLIFAVSLKRPYAESGRGLNFLLVIALSSAAAIFLEAFRGDSVLLSGGIRAVQIIGLGVLMASLWLMRVWGSLPDVQANR